MRNPGFGSDVNKLLRLAEKLGCTWKCGGHMVRVFGPDGTFLCAMSSSARGGGGLQRTRQLRSKLRRLENAGG